ncbi:RNA polymerase sigma factor [Irregularibacter muris]|uniref:RNA polymerase sigma factor n=1 Tax=Irregularibacter muris TaxID=1796619 RepID=A0AAE3L090_9FIRM|nr:RNA polymerase sigma factor [Irregularibacter muris]MCR1899941.1 RNA polymerase sigma factor [Irregularibacter muris]
MEEIFLVKKAKAGDKEALVSLIMAKKSEYYKLAYIYMKNSEDSLDALEDMIVILYQKINTLKKEEAFYPWSKKILVSCCLRKIRREKKIILVDNWEQKDDRNHYHSKEQQIDIEKELNKLSPKHQEAIRLKYYLDMDYQTISKITNTSLGTVKSRVFYALKKLKESFGGEY